MFPINFELAEIGPCDVESKCKVGKKCRRILFVCFVTINAQKIGIIGKDWKFEPFLKISIRPRGWIIMRPVKKCAFDNYVRLSKLFCPNLYGWPCFGSDEVNISGSFISLSEKRIEHLTYKNILERISLTTPLIFKPIEWKLKCNRIVHSLKE